MTKPLRFSPPLYDDAEVEAVVRCLRNGWVGTGPMTLEFEKLFTSYITAPYGTALSSCTAALFLSLKALDIGPGDEVITSSMTFCSTVNSILHVGATPVLCDIDPYSKNINIHEIPKHITSNTKAIIPVHYAGYPCDMTTITSIATQHSLHIIEDCAHAVESTHNYKHVGTFGDFGCFSFYATKNLAIGEGGMVVTSNPELHRLVSTLRLHGLSRDAWKRFEESTKRQYDVVELGYKMNMTDIQAVIGIEQFKKLPSSYERRVQIWDYYTQELASSSLELPNLTNCSGYKHALHLITSGLPDYINRDEFVWRMSDEYGILLGVHYNSIPSYTLYKRYKSALSDPSLYPIALDWGSRTISLSLSAAVTDDDIQNIVFSINKLLSSYD
jgi:dTDP-4-amino-4,6-dideoxygalactose transaminase